MTGRNLGIGSEFFILGGRSYLLKVMTLKKKKNPDTKPRRWLIPA